MHVYKKFTVKNFLRFLTNILLFFRHFSDFIMESITLHGDSDTEGGVRDNSQVNNVLCQLQQQQLQFQQLMASMVTMQQDLLHLRNNTG